MSLSQGGMVDVNKLDTVLGNMGMSLTEEELKELTQNLPENGKHANITVLHKSTGKCAFFLQKPQSMIIWNQRALLEKLQEKISLM